MEEIRECSLEINPLTVQKWLEQFRNIHNVDKTEEEPEYMCPWIWG